MKKLLDELKEDHSALVDEVVPDLLTVGEVQRVLQNLLREGVPIRDLVTILETLGDSAGHQGSRCFLTERVREALARQISKLYTGDQGYIPVITLDPALEQEIADALQHTDRGLTIALAPERVEALLRRPLKSLERAAAAGHQAVVLARP